MGRVQSAREQLECKLYVEERSMVTCLEGSEFGARDPTSNWALMAAMMSEGNLRQ
jgi:hypothetical protein